MVAKSVGCIVAVLMGEWCEKGSAQVCCFSAGCYQVFVPSFGVDLLRAAL